MGSRNPHAQETTWSCASFVYYNNDDCSFGVTKKQNTKKTDLHKKALDESGFLRLGPPFTMLTHAIRFAHTRAVIVVVIVVAPRWWRHWSPERHGLLACRCSSCPCCFSLICSLCQFPKCSHLSSLSLRLSLSLSLSRVLWTKQE